MQALRQCSVCAGRATGGFLSSPKEVSVLRGNKNLIRKGALVCSLNTSESAPLSSRKPGVQTSGERTSAANMSISSPSLARGLFTQHVEMLAHDSLIRRAASVVTDSSSTFLSQTTLALIDALTNYSNAVHTRIAVQRRHLASFGKLTPAEENSLLQAINGLRAEVTDRLDECKRFESSWVNAVNLCKMAAEAASNSGAEHASITVRTNIQVSQSQVEEARRVSADADRRLAETKVEEIQRMAEYAASLEQGEEHEVHEAYLRED